MHINFVLFYIVHTVCPSWLLLATTQLASYVYVMVEGEKKLQL